MAVLVASVVNGLFDVCFGPGLLGVNARVTPPLGRAAADIVLVAAPVALAACCSAWAMLRNFAYNPFGSTGG